MLAVTKISPSSQLCMDIMDELYNSKDQTENAISRLDPRFDTKNIYSFFKFQNL